MTRRTAANEPGYFDALYAAEPDPWRFATSAYEAEKYAATLAALPPGHFASALEVGCSIGVLTTQLAQRCDQLLALDVAEAALAQARSANPSVRFERRRIPQAWPPGRFDLILLSEVLYYFDRAGIVETARRAVRALQPGGCILMVHYLGETDYPATGDEAAEWFAQASRAEGLRLGHASWATGYRLDRLDRD